MRILVSLLLALCAVGIPTESRYESSLSTHWGVKGGVGIALFGLTTVGYEIIGVYHISQPESRFEWNVVDWDPNIDDPNAGWAPGASLVGDIDSRAVRS